MVLRQTPASLQTVRETRGADKAEQSYAEAPGAATIIVGAHHLPFVFLYGMPLSAVLAGLLTFGGWRWSSGVRTSTPWADGSRAPSCWDSPYSCADPPASSASDVPDDPTARRRDGGHAQGPCSRGPSQPAGVDGQRAPRRAVRWALDGMAKSAPSSQHVVTKRGRRGQSLRSGTSQQVQPTTRSSSRARNRDVAQERPLR
jgi:hypothetical protein